MTHPIRFGIQTGQQGVQWSELLDLWQKADAWGYDSLWAFDHFYPIFVDPAGPCLEGWTLVAALAQATRRARVGHLVTGNTYRHPCVTAKMAATVDHVSGGRLNLGIGAGWFELEHRSFGIDFKTVRRPARGARRGVPDHPRDVHAGEDDAARKALHGHRRDGPAEADAAPASADHDRRHRQEGAARRSSPSTPTCGTRRAAPEGMAELIEIIARHGDAVGRDTGEIEKTVMMPLCYKAPRERQEFMCNLIVHMRAASPSGARTITPEQARREIMIGDKAGVPRHDRALRAGRRDALHLHDLPAVLPRRDPGVRRRGDSGDALGRCAGAGGAPAAVRVRDSPAGARLAVGTGSTQASTRLSGRFTLQRGRASPSRRRRARMAERFEITDEMRAVIGKEWPPWTFEVTTTSVRAFARGVGYTDRVYFDVEAARRPAIAACPRRRPSSARRSSSRASRATPSARRQRASRA